MVIIRVTEGKGFPFPPVVRYVEIGIVFFCLFKAAELVICTKRFSGFTIFCRHIDVCVWLFLTGFVEGFPEADDAAEVTHPTKMTGKTSAEYLFSK